MVDKKFPLGSLVHGRVVSLVDYGAFVELEEGVEGLVHVSEMSWTKKVVNPNKVLNVGDEVDAIVSELDMANRRISLSLRQTEANPWEDLANDFPVGTIIEGHVRNLTEFGAFVEITDEIDGLIHVSLNPGIRIAALAAAFATGGRLDEALLAVIVGEVAFLAISLAILLARTRPVFDGTPAIAGSLLKFGARLEGAAIIGQVDLRIAGFIVAYFAAADQLAFYAIAEGLVFYVVTIPTLVGQVLLPKIAREDAEVAADMTAAACRSTLFVTSGMLLVLGAVSHPLLGLLYGEEYLPAAMILVVLLPVALGRSGLRILGRYIIVSNHLYWIGAANAASLAAHVALLVHWVPTYGVIGAAAATSVSVMLRFAILVAAFRRLTDVGLLEILLVRGDDITRIWRAGLDILSLRALRSSPKGDA